MAILWLSFCKIDVINKILKEENVKIFMSYIGLLTSCYGNATKIAILNNEDSLNAGAIYEKFVGYGLNSFNYVL